MWWQGPNGGSGGCGGRDGTTVDVVVGQTAVVDDVVGRIAAVGDLVVGVLDSADNSSSGPREDIFNSFQKYLSCANFSARQKVLLCGIKGA
jgi:hypothetical protein